MMETTGPRLEGSVQVRGQRRLGFAEFGDPHGRAMLWMHGTPGARRQIPEEARVLAAAEGIRLVGLDRPGIGSSTPYVYDDVLDFTSDLEIFLDRLGIGELGVIGLSGGGPYTLAAGYAFPDRVRALGVLGGVAPTVGDDAIGGGLIALGGKLRPLVSVGRVPLGFGLTAMLRMLRPFGNTGIGLYARLSPEGDRRLLGRPEFKAMFLDDLLNGSRKQMSAPLADVLLFTKHWGFALSDVKVPVAWWHGDHDHIVPFAHGEHVVSRLPEATLTVLHGESHLGGLGVALEVLPALRALWDAG